MVCLLRGMRPWLAVCGVLLAPGCSAEDFESDGSDASFRELVVATTPDLARIPAPLPAAFCAIKVIGQTDYDIESNYLPRTVYCENGGGDLEALKAQAIAARSVVYYEAALDGSICDSESCQHASCVENSAAATLAEVPDDVFRAVNETSGMYLKYDDTLTYAFYVAGSKTFHGTTCIGNEGGAPTEKWVTYNNLKTGTSVEQTTLGSVFVPSDREYGQNRGCMSQWGARCLDQGGAQALDILRFYYGADIEVAKAEGACVDPGPTVDDSAQCGDGACADGETEDTCPVDCQPCGTIAPDAATILEEDDGCFALTGEPQYIHAQDGVGHGRGLVWTESTEFDAHTEGTWRLNFERAGSYRVEAFVEPDFAQEERARYRVTHDGEESNMRVDQARADGWLALGVFDFEAGFRDQTLRLTDLSGERGNTIVFDAVRITPATPGDQDKFDDVTAGAHRGGASQGCAVGATVPAFPACLWVLTLVGLRRRQRRA